MAEFSNSNFSAYINDVSQNGEYQKTDQSERNIIHLLNGVLNWCLKKKARRNKSDFWSLNEEVITTPSSHDIGLWELDNTIGQELSKLAGKKPKSQSAYSDEDRYLVAKYAKKLNTLNTSKYRLLNFSKYTAINESIVRAFVKKYDQNVKVAKAWGRSPNKKLNNLMRGRSLMVGLVIDEKVRKFMVYFIKSGNVGRSIAAATAMVLASRTDGESVKNLFVTSTWGRNLLQKTGLRRWAVTAAKVKIPDSPKKEAGLQHH